MVNYNLLEKCARYLRGTGVDVTDNGDGLTFAFPWGEEISLPASKVRWVLEIMPTTQLKTQKQRGLWMVIHLVQEYCG